MRELELGAFRRRARWLTVLSVLATVLGIYAAVGRRWGLAGLGVGVGIVLLYLVQRAGIQATPGSERVLVFLTRADCTLCEEAEEVLAELTKDTPFLVERLSVDSSRFLKRHFADAVPVLLWQGEELGRLRWDAAALRTRLDGIRAAWAKAGPAPGENP